MTNTSTRITSWNINGIRSLEDFQDRIKQSDADIICIQETKVTRDMLTEDLALISGFTSYYSFSRRRSGYSGVATYCKLHCTPCEAEEGLCGLYTTEECDVSGLDDIKIEFSSEERRSIDSEGRCVITKHNLDDDSGRLLIVINLYCPRADSERPDRAKFKMLFYKAVDIRANAFKKKGHMVVVLGDINTSHKEIDHCDPYEEFEDHPGRRFLNHFLQSENPSEKDREVKSSQEDEVVDEWKTVNVEVEEKQFVDTFRTSNPDRKLAFTCWNTRLNCRSTNYGTRIDYIFCSLELLPFLIKSDIQPDVLGSDHCPISAEFGLIPKASDKAPGSCTKYYKEFSGKQAKVSDFFIRNNNATVNKSDEVIKISNAKSEMRVKSEAKRKITNFFIPDSKKIKCDDSNRLTKTEEKPEVNASTLLKTETTDRNSTAKSAWGALFKPPPPAPLCTKHREEALKRKVIKKGPNLGREFWVCRRGEGRADDPEARCNFFKWVKG